MFADRFVEMVGEIAFRCGKFVLSVNGRRVGQQGLIGRRRVIVRGTEGRCEIKLHLSFEWQAKENT